MVLFSNSFHSLLLPPLSHTLLLPFSNNAQCVYDVCAEYYMGGPIKKNLFKVGIVMAIKKATKEIFFFVWCEDRRSILYNS